MKRILALVLSLILCFGLSACGKKESGDTKTTTVSSVSTEQQTDDTPAVSEKKGFNSELEHQIILGDDPSALDGAWEMTAQMPVAVGRRGLPGYNGGLYHACRKSTAPGS